MFQLHQATSAKTPGPPMPSMHHFSYAKVCVSPAPILTLPDPQKQFVVEVDAAHWWQ